MSSDFDYFLALSYHPFKLDDFFRWELCRLTGFRTTSASNEHALNRSVAVLCSITSAHPAN